MNKLLRFVVAVPLIGAVLAARAQVSADDVESWLDRMNVAVEELNYRGSYVHISNGDAEMFGIAHRYADGEVGERITIANDNAREFLRTNDMSITVLPEERRVLVEEPQSASMLRAGSLFYTNALQSFYAASTVSKGNVAGRATQYISLEARDGYRYGYRLWIDRASGFPLKSQVIGEEGQIVEQILFTEIDFVDAIPEAEVVPPPGVDRFEWVRRATPEPDLSSDEIWGATRLPDGFRLSVSRQSLLAGSTYPVQHLVYTDGLATVSVFIAHPESTYGADVSEGLVRRGGMSMYSVRIDGRLATVIGEVPPRTVRRIATSLDAD